MPWHGMGNDASAAAGARVETSRSVEMRPALQREHDSERAEARRNRPGKLPGRQKQKFSIFKRRM
eukprot:5096060-Pyramimonas_sp.AAC.1